MLVNFALTSKIHGGIWEKKGGMVQLIDVGRWLAIGWGYVVYCDVKPGRMGGIFFLRYFMCISFF